MDVTTRSALASFAIIIFFALRYPNHADILLLFLVPFVLCWVLAAKALGNQYNLMLNLTHPHNRDQHLPPSAYPPPHPLAPIPTTA